MTLLLCALACERDSGAAPQRVEPTDTGATDSEPPACPARPPRAFLDSPITVRGPTREENGNYVYFGHETRLADVDGDGCHDLVASAPGLDLNDPSPESKQKYTEGGGVYLWYGSPDRLAGTALSHLQADASWTGAFGWQMGYQLYPVDADRDGAMDLLAGVYVDNLFCTDPACCSPFDQEAPMGLLLLHGGPRSGLGGGFDFMTASGATDCSYSDEKLDQALQSLGAGLLRRPGLLTGFTPGAQVTGAAETYGSVREQGSDNSWKVTGVSDRTGLVDWSEAPSVFTRYGLSSGSPLPIGDLHGDGQSELITMFTEHYYGDPLYGFVGFLFLGSSQLPSVLEVGPSYLDSGNDGYPAALLYGDYNPADDVEGCSRLGYYCHGVEDVDLEDVDGDGRADLMLTIRDEYEVADDHPCVRMLPGAGLASLPELRADRGPGPRPALSLHDLEREVGSVAVCSSEPNRRVYYWGRFGGQPEACGGDPGVLLLLQCGDNISRSNCSVGLVSASGLFPEVGTRTESFASLLDLGPESVADPSLGDFDCDGVLDLAVWQTTDVDYEWEVRVYLGLK